MNFHTTWKEATCHTDGVVLTSHFDEYFETKNQCHEKTNDEFNITPLPASNTFRLPFQFDKSHQQYLEVAVIL